MAEYSTHVLLGTAPAVLTWEDQDWEGDAYALGLIVCIGGFDRDIKDFIDADMLDDLLASAQRDLRAERDADRECDADGARDASRDAAISWLNNSGI